MEYELWEEGRVFLIEYQGLLRKFWLAIFMNSEKRYVVEHSEVTVEADEVTRWYILSKYVDYTEKEKEGWEKCPV